MQRCKIYKIKQTTEFSIEKAGILSLKNVCNEGLRDYVKSIRIEKTQEMLLKTNNNVDTIAQNVGFDNVNSFLRTFKGYYGITPSEYRKKHL